MIDALDQTSITLSLFILKIFSKIFFSLRDNVLLLFTYIDLFFITS